MTDYYMTIIFGSLTISIIVYLAYKTGWIH